jgi:hypothetical protein
MTAAWVESAHHHGITHHRTPDPLPPSDDPTFCRVFRGLRGRGGYRSGDRSCSLSLSAGTASARSGAFEIIIFGIFGVMFAITVTVGLLLWRSSGGYWYVCGEIYSLTIELALGSTTAEKVAG